MEVIEHPVKICDPQDQNNDHQAVQDRFDLSLHGYEPVHNPQQKSCGNKRDEYSCKRHIVFSNRFLRFGAPGHRREVANDRLAWRGSQRKEENEYSASFSFFQVNGEIADP